MGRRFLSPDYGENMSEAVCLTCGSPKRGALSVCEKCGMTALQAEVICSVNRAAKERLQAPTSNLAGPPKERKGPETALHRNAFALLGATTRDDRRRIVELSEERSLEIDQDACQKARSDLTNPRTRLGAEVAWLPGVSPKKAAQMTELLRFDPKAVCREEGLPTLAHTNLLVAAFESVDDGDPPRDVAEFINKIANLADLLSPDEVLRDINEDRAVSGFPEVRGVDQIEAELAERKRIYRDAIKKALDRLETSAIVEILTDVVEFATVGGEAHAPELIDELVDLYAIEVQEFLQNEAENIRRLIEAVTDAAASGETAVAACIDRLERVARNWDKVAQPVQLSTKARGMDHAPSHEIAHAIRDLSVDLFNKHGMIAQSQRLTELIRELFAEVPEVSERAKEDIDALADILRNRKEAEEQESEWQREITYRAEVGAIFKKVLSISPEGVAWSDRRYPLDSVTRVRWGAVRRSVNGIPTGTVHTIAFGDKYSEAVVELKNGDVFSTFVDKLWRAVGVRLLTKMLKDLRNGGTVQFGDAAVRDGDITLVKHKFLSSSPERRDWSQVQVWSADGSFYIGAKDDRKTYVSLSYIDGDNTHVLENAIRFAFKKPGLRRLSDLLN